LSAAGRAFRGGAARPAWRRWLGSAAASGVALRFLLALLAAAAAASVPLAAGTPPGHLRVASGVAFASGAMLGPAGIAGSALGALAPLLLAPGHALAPLLLAAAADGLLAAIAWLVFRFGGGVGRGLPDLASYLAALGAAHVGLLLAAPLLAVAAAEPRYEVALGLQLVAGLSGTVLLGLPLMLWARGGLRGRHAPVPGERLAPPLEVLEDEPDGTELETLDSEATLLAAPSRARARRGIAAGAVLIGTISLVAVPFAALIPDGGSWIALGYLLAVIWGARTYGLRGGVACASVAGLAFLVLAGLLERLLGGVDPDPLSLYPQLLLLSPVGAYLGWAREREVTLRREVVTHGRLLRQDLLRVVRALTSAIEAKDSYTESHLRRVGDYAVAVGTRLGLRGRALETLYYAAMLHDVGKIGVPESVLRKPGPLGPEERTAMQRHPEIGARIVSGLDLLSDAAPLILHHQERWDGGDATGYPGYPAGLRGEAIPLGARIIAVVDTYDAMTTHRPYRAALPLGDAVAELRREAGRQFDPTVVDAFLEVLRERPWED
jgi:HD-GYP domain-containing protein (c-di-GMP phosphodiesterase class II)